MNDLFIGKSEFEDQRERMIREYGISEEEAEEAFKNVKTQVMLASQDMGKNWSDETVEAVTNIVIGIQQQQVQNSQRRRRGFYNRLYRFIVGIFQTGTGASGAFLVGSGYLIPGAVLIIFSITAFMYNMIE